MAFKCGHSGDSSARKHLKPSWRTRLRHLWRRWAPTSGRWLVEDTPILTAVSPSSVKEQHEREGRNDAGTEHGTNDNSGNLAPGETTTTGRIMIGSYRRCHRR
jgi:hypothetical protein